MELIKEFITRKAPHSHIDEVDFTKLEFGTYVSDHMVVCDFQEGTWQTPKIVPFANLSISPSALALHYGQTVFEGMKAFPTQDGRVNVFRIERHYRRFVRSLERMCMEPVPEEIFTEGIRQLVELDRQWVPREPGSALYIRPFMYASENRFRVKPADEYRFIIFTGPVPALYPQPLRVKVETDYIRAARGGTGFAKCGGNYGGSLLAFKQARSEGYDQVLWTDAMENKYIEELGMMNVMLVIDQKLVTPPVSDTILDGITRDSLLTLARDSGMVVEERKISLDEIRSAFEAGTLTEAFGVGTAAVVSPIGVIGIGETDYTLPKYSHEHFSARLKDKLERIRSGIEPDTYGWNSII